jgi:hypothetical protein
VLEMRKKHGITPKIPRCSGPDIRNEQDTGTQGAITNGTPVPLPQVRTTPHIGGPAGRQNPRWLTAARFGSSDNDLRSGRPNSSSDDLRADAAATRPSPTTPLEGRGQATKAVEPEVSPREAPTISSVEKPLPATSMGGGTGSGVEAAQAGEPDTRQLPAPRTANALPPRSLREGAGQCPRGDRPKVGALPSPALMMKILEADGGVEAAARLASPHHQTGGHRLG